MGRIKKDKMDTKVKIERYCEDIVWKIIYEELCKVLLL